MKKKFSMAMCLAVILALAFTPLALAAQGDVLFTTDAPCPVTVQVLSYTNPANQPGQTASGSTPWTLAANPSTAVTFFYPASVTCNGVAYNFVSVSPGNPITSGAATVTVTGHYALPAPDVTSPVWTVPANFSVQATGPGGAAVSYTALASDPDDAVSSQACMPVSGSMFTLGTTIVHCTATDTHNNTGTASFNVTVVDTTPPALSLPADITINAISASGAAVNFTASAADLVDGSAAVICLPASGSLFPLGTNPVNCSTTDAHGNTASGSFNIIVMFTVINDATPPVWTVPADFSVEAAGPAGAVVTYTATAADPDDAVDTQSCSPASGSTFALGNTTVNCTATDTHGNSGIASFNVTVVDTTAPVLNLPADMTVEATSASGAAVNFIAAAMDLVDGSVAAVCSPASGSTFPFGMTVVNCSATDAHNNTAMGSFNITVVDQTPPVLDLPADITVTALNASGAAVSFAASANDQVDGSVTVICSPVSGSQFPIGQTAVNCSAVDSHGNTASGSFTVSVQYAAAGINCKGVPGHQILRPVNADGSSVFKAGSTVPAKFRVCGSDGNGIGTPGVVTSFRLIKIISGDGTESNVDEPVSSTTPDTEFRSGNQQWIFNIDTKGLDAGSIYVYLITLNDGSTIQFQFDLK